MRDYPDADQTSPTVPVEATEAPRGRDAAALDMTPAARAGGIWFEIFEGPSKHPVIETAYRATKIGLTIGTGVVLVLAVWALTLG